MDFKNLIVDGEGFGGKEKPKLSKEFI